MPQTLRILRLCLALLLLSRVCVAQETTSDPGYIPQPLPPPQGTVLFSGPTATLPAQATAATALAVTDAERNAITMTAYDLNAHLSPATAGLAVAAKITLRNSGSAPLSRLALQLSSSLHWESLSLIGPNGAEPLRFAHQSVTTDADHTGSAEEAVVPLPQRLAPGASVTLDVLYSGAIRSSEERLRRIGVPSRDAAFADWDRIDAQGTALRGFGDVLWYPVAANPVLLGDGAKLFQTAGEQKLRQRDATIRLRLTVEYVGQAPKQAFFNGESQPLRTSGEEGAIQPVDSPGIATASFGPAVLGFRTLSLFVTDAGVRALEGGLLDVAPLLTQPSTDISDDRLKSYVDGAQAVRALLASWLGPTPTAPLVLLDHSGQAFEDRTMLVGPLPPRTSEEAAQMLVHSLTHSWFRSHFVWLDEGVPQFFALLWLERTQGRAAAAAAIEQQDQTLAVAEARLSGGSESTAATGESLVEAYTPIYYRDKSVAVLSMLRSMVGEASLKAALQRCRTLGDAEDAHSLEKALQTASGKDLQWFFDDWVYHDRGLPDLSIVSVSPREMPASGERQASWLIAVEVGNDGGAAAEVPITVRSGSLTRTEHLRVAAKSKASIRIVFEGKPEELVVNDGSVPEVGVSRHTAQLSVH